MLFFSIILAPTKEPVVQRLREILVSLCLESGIYFIVTVAHFTCFLHAHKCILVYSMSKGFWSHRNISNPEFPEICPNQSPLYLVCGSLLVVWEPMANFATHELQKFCWWILVVLSEVDEYLLVSWANPVLFGPYDLPKWPPGTQFTFQ